MKINILLLKYFSFVAACIVVIIAFITATTYLQLAVAILLYPVLVIFAHNVLVGARARYSTRVSTISPYNSQAAAIHTEKIESSEMSRIRVSDIDKRVFLKLVGGAGIFLFLFSLLSKKTESIFFKNLPLQSPIIPTGDNTVGSNNINTAQNQPLGGYTITEIEDDIVSFYGFTNNEGFWYIMKVDTQTGSFRYVQGTSNFASNWAKREKLNYDYYSDVFKN